MPGSSTRAAFIDRAAIRDNAAEIVRRSKGARLSPDVSADGFGHGEAIAAAAAADGGLTGDDGSLAPGEHLYGLVEDESLRAAMRVSGLVVGTKTVEAGEGVSYGYTWRASRRTNLALVGIGYADGLDRRASNVGSLWLNGAYRLIAGRVAMNALVLDLGDDTVAVGDEAVVLGDVRRGEPSASRWASALGVSATQVVTVFGQHLPRVVL